MISASKLERLHACPLSAALPQVRETTEEATAGTSNHSRIEDQLVEGNVALLPPVVMQAVTGSKHWLVEPAFVVNTRNGAVRFLGERIGRAYGKVEDYEVACSADLICVDTQQVWDWKSSKRVAHPSVNLQLRCLAFCALRHLGWDSCTVGIGYLDNNWHDSAPYGGMDAVETLATLVRIVRAVERAKANPAGADPHVGPWCSYCPAIRDCRAHATMAMTIIGELDRLHAQMGEWTDEQAGLAWEKLEQIDKIADMVKKSIRARVEGGGFVPLSGDRMLAKSEGTRQSLDKGKVAEVLARHGENMDQCMKTTSYVSVRTVKRKP